MTPVSRGFTLIELLVIVSILGIISVMVLASLGTARSKGSDAAIKVNLNTIKTQAEVYFYSTGSGKWYNSNGTTGVASADCTALTNTVLSNTTVWGAIVAARTAGGGAAANAQCAVANSGASYAIAIQSRSVPTNWYCVDSSGSNNKIVTSSALGGGASTAVCPP